MTGGKRMIKLIDSGFPFKGGVFLDIYHTSYDEKIAMTIRTTIDSSSLHYVTQVYETR